MTEDEANQKWCPFVRLNVPDGSTDVLIMNNRAKRAISEETTNGQMCGCLASKCMAWRWSQEISGPQNFEYKTGNPSQVHGYCGLAGKP